MFKTGCDAQNLGAIKEKIPINNNTYKLYVSKTASEVNYRIKVILSTEAFLYLFVRNLQRTRLVPDHALYGMKCGG